MALSKGLIIMMSNNTTVLYRNNTPVLEKSNFRVFNYAMKFSERVKKARLHAKLSQEELALLVGCTQGLISKIERGDQEESALIVKIAKACKVSAQWLDDGSGEMDLTTPYMTEDVAVYLKAMQMLPEYARAEVTRFAIKTAELITQAQANTNKNGTQ